MSDSVGTFLASATFPAEMQKRFAEFSGDYNPMHIDEIAARRFLYGTTVAHGVHVIIRALDALLSDEPGTLKQIIHLRARFSAPVVTGSTVEYRVSRLEEDSIRVIAKCAGATAMDLSMRLSDRHTVEVDLPHDPRPLSHRIPDTLTSRDFEKRIEGSVSVTASSGNLESLFPQVFAKLPPKQIAALLACTRIVGMKCPGYHSIFSELELDFDPATTNCETLDYSLEGWDQRFRLATLSVGGDGIQGKLKAFLRPTPYAQSSVGALTAQINPEEFSNVRALVAGGSRGLGEYVAKLMGTGGASVCLTYHRGADDAEIVVKELQNVGANACSLQYDASSDDHDQLVNLGRWKPTHLFFFATPPIFHAGRGGFSDQHFSSLCQVYLVGFSRLVNKLLAESDLRYVFFPSTEFLDKLPKGMPEYIAAKGAGEAFCDYLAKRHLSVKFVTARLPRAPTDQTADMLSPPPGLSVAYLRKALSM